MDLFWDKESYSWFITTTEDVRAEDRKYADTCRTGHVGDCVMQARLTDITTGPEGVELGFSPEDDRIKDYAPFLGKKFFLFICDDADE
jgi:hypothetical protein